MLEESKVIKSKNKKAKLTNDTEFTVYKSWRELPHVPVSKPSKGSIGNTGDWRTFRPEIDTEKCNQCGSDLERHAVYLL